MKTGIELIADERAEQIEKHGITIEEDVNKNRNYELPNGAIMSITGYIDKMPYGWNYKICQHIVGKPYKERLIIAGALIAAEIDKLQAIE
jgi:hypothetical protein